MDLLLDMSIHLSGPNLLALESTSPAVDWEWIVASDDKKTRDFERTPRGSEMASRSGDDREVKAARVNQWSPARCKDGHG
jgi:hypothetical protein